MSATVTKIERYGWRRDKLDPRDTVFNMEHTIYHGWRLPSSHDLTNEMPPVYDQLQLGSCTANAAGAVMQHAQMKQGESEGQQVPSRLFIYYNERKLESMPLDQDTGAEVRDGFKVLATMGVPPESEWPYSDTNPGPFQQEPPPQAYTDALHYEATAYKAVDVGGPGAPMRSAIAQGYPIAFGFQVPDYFEMQDQWNPATQYLPVPDPATTNFIGGHAVVIVGYDWTRARFDAPVFKVRNSWGSSWGESGYFYMNYHWFDKSRGLASDYWVVTQAS